MHNKLYSALVNRNVRNFLFFSLFYIFVGITTAVFVKKFCLRMAYGRMTVSGFRNMQYIGIRKIAAFSRTDFVLLVFFFLNRTYWSENIHFVFSRRFFTITFI